VVTPFFERGTKDGSLAAYVWVNPDGSFFAAGNAGSTDGVLPNEHMAVAAYDADGSLRTEFGDGGKVLIPDIANFQAGMGGGLVATDDGRPVVLVPGVYSGNLVRLLPTPSAAVATVAGRHLVYKYSGFDNQWNSDPFARPDAAIAPDKRALLPGEAASFANVSSFTSGINCVMVDLRGLPFDAIPTADDFLLRSGTSPDASNFTTLSGRASVSVRRGAGTGGSDRVMLYWSSSDPHARNAWLQVAVKATDNTRLASPDVFYFGSLVGETGNGGGATGWRVNAEDLGAVKRALNTDATITNRFDFNRDGRITASDLGAIKANLNRVLPPLMAPPISPVAATESPARRRVAEGVLT
jgi:hypothetical protein